MLIILKTAFLTLSFADVIAKWEECQGEQDCPQNTGLCCHLWEQTQQAALVDKSTRDKQQICFQFRRTQSNNHIKKSHLLIPGGPSKCLSGFLKVLGSEGPTWVSSALSLPVCDWKNGWAELLCHWIMDSSFYSWISRWPVGPYSRGVFWLQPHTRTPLELLGAAQRATTSYTLSVSRFSILTLYPRTSVQVRKKEACAFLFVSLIFKDSYLLAPCCIPRNLLSAEHFEKNRWRMHISI